VVVPEGYFQRGDGRGVEGIGGPGSHRFVSQHGIAPAAGLGARISMKLARVPERVRGSSE